MILEFLSNAFNIDDTLAALQYKVVSVSALILLCILQKPHSHSVLLCLESINSYPKEVAVLNPSVSRLNIGPGQIGAVKVGWEWYINSYSLNICVSPKFTCWNPNRQCDGIRCWGLREMIRSRG